MKKYIVMIAILALVCLAPALAVASASDDRIAILSAQIAQVSAQLNQLLAEQSAADNVAFCSALKQDSGLNSQVNSEDEEINEIITEKLVNLSVCGF